jgi:hypothetical protein
MRPGKTKRFWPKLAFLVGMCLPAAAMASAPTTPFCFTLDEPCTASAGVFALDGTLIRTLWSKVPYQPGAFAAAWDGLDDNSNAVSAGTYEIRLLQHNVEYVWDGAIGNTSEKLSGPGVHTGYWPMLDMAVGGTNAFYVSGYNEGGFDFRSFSTTRPQLVTARWGPGGPAANIYDPFWAWTATDGVWVYFGCAATYTPQGGYGPGCVVAYNVADHSPAQFSSGVIISNGANVPFPGIYVGTNFLDGLAVQGAGNLLAVAVALDNTVYLLDKRAGTILKRISIASPGRLSFSPDGTLWVVSGTSVINYTNLTSAPAVAATISGFNQPLAVAASATNADLVLVADGIGSEQIKAFSRGGSPLWTLGMPGGYQSNGAAVATNKFWFDDGQGDASTFITFCPDNSFWVGDGANHRSLHFSAARNYLEQIMYQPHSYLASVDQNNPARVFNQFLEFSVDYSKPLQQSWSLVNNWMAGVDAVHLVSSFYQVDKGNQGIYEVTTFPNGRTYALINNYTYNYPISELCELTSPQLRLTGIFPAYGGNSRGWISLGPDGSARRTTMGAPSWFKDSLAGFDANNNPLWNPEALLASAPQGGTDPVPRLGGFGNIRATVSSNNILVSFDQSLNNGWHLGGIRAGASNWLWKASPAVNTMDGRGTYEIGNGVQYGGNSVQAVDRHVIYGYHGEFFRHAGQASQTMHFYDDGLFIGQFGECNIGHTANEGAVPASAGNGYAPSLVRPATGGYYLWVNDESGHGPQRWHLVNAGNIREQSGTGLLGSAIILTNPPSAFPAAVTGQPGNHSVQLQWLAVPGATSYNVRYSLLNGGPYNILAASVTNSSQIVGLTNDQAYYFAVTAISPAGESAPSEQVRLTPFDTTQNVLSAGSLAEAGLSTPVIDVRSAAVAARQNSLVAAEHLAGPLTLRDLNDFGFGDLRYPGVGREGYAIYDPEGPGTVLINLSSNFTHTFGSGWWDAASLERQYRVDNLLHSNHGMIPGPSSPACSVSLNVSDTNYHVLTVVSPALFNNQTFAADPRLFTMRLTSFDNSSAAFAVNEAYGYTHTFQYLFKGNVTLWTDASGGGGGTLQALFLDPATVASTSTPAKFLGSVQLGVSGPNLLLNAAGAPAGDSFVILTSTNLSLPLGAWTSLATNRLGLFGASGYILPNALSPALPKRFYVLRMQ